MEYAFCQLQREGKIPQSAEAQLANLGDPESLSNAELKRVIEQKGMFR